MTSIEIENQEFFKIKTWNAVAYTTQKNAQTKCLACENDFQQRCKSCQQSKKQNSENVQEEEETRCLIAWGQCNHGYHIHCIEQQMKDSNECKICKKEWRIQRFDY